MIEAIKARIELAEALEITPAELDKRSRRAKHYNPYAEDVPETHCPHCGVACAECYADCVERV